MPVKEHTSVAQLVEQLTCNQLVGGSSPSTGSSHFEGVRRSGRAGPDCKSGVFD
jgi:hypothetical protein